MSLRMASGAAYASGASADLRITVNAARVQGHIKPLAGVNGAPDLTFLGASASGPFGAAQNVTAGYRAAGVNLVRTHDSQGAADIDAHLGTLPPIQGPFAGPPEAARGIDLNVIFPDPAADPDDERSYHFGPTDQLLAAIHGIGAEVLFRIGRSGMTTAAAPDDPARYAAIVRHVVLHYNQGWAAGTHDRVRYWEVWNEPDLGQIFWRGTPEQYYALYSAAAAAIKSADPTALVGGPAIARVNEPGPYREGFLEYVRAHRLPLDFFSWHWYSMNSGDPYDFVRIGRALRAQLDRYGFGRTLSVLDEWNYDFRELRRAPPVEVAAFITSALIYMQDAPIDLQALYRADHEFGPDGGARTAAGQALLQWGRMLRTPRRLRVSGGDRLGLAVLAGRSADGGIIQLLVSNYMIPAANRGPRPGGDVMHEQGLFDLALLPRRTVAYPRRERGAVLIEGLGRGRGYRLEHFRLSGTTGFELLETRDASGPVVRAPFDPRAPSIDLYVLTRS